MIKNTWLYILLLVSLPLQHCYYIINDYIVTATTSSYTNLSLWHLRVCSHYCKGRTSEMRGWSSGTRGVTRDVPVTRDKDRRYQTEDGVRR